MELWDKLSIQIDAIRARKKDNPLHGNGFTLPFPEKFIRNYYEFTSLIVNLTK